MRRALLLTLLVAAPLTLGSAALTSTATASAPAATASAPAASSRAVLPDTARSTTSTSIQAPKPQQVAVNFPGAPKEAQAFLERVFKRLPPPNKIPSDFQFQSWTIEGKPTDEGVGVMPMPGVNPEKLITRVMYVDHYLGNIDRVLASKSIPDALHKPPQQVHFYQGVDVSPIGKVQQELVLVDAGTINGYRVAYWYLLKDRTDKLNPDQGARSQYNVGAWIVAPGVVAYALSSAPRREDVNYVQWKFLTTGANVAAGSVVKNNIEGMSRWAAKLK